MTINNDLIIFLDSKFGVSTEIHELDTESEYFKKLQEALAQRIAFFINSDIERLLQILYQIDISQQDTDDAFNLGEVKKISYALAEKIIRRQLQKIDYARKFNQSKE